MNPRLKLALVVGCAFVSALTGPRAGAVFSQGLRGPYAPLASQPARTGVAASESTRTALFLDSQGEQGGLALRLGPPGERFTELYGKSYAEPLWPALAQAGE